MDLVQNLFADLHSSDPSIRLSVLSRIESLEWSSEQRATFKTLIEKEKDRGTRFHMQKILAKIDGRKPSEETTDGDRVAPDRVSPDRVAEMSQLIKDENRDDLTLALLLETIGPTEAPLVAMELREARWQEFSSLILPFLLQFFKRFGSYEDAPVIEELCRHHDPRVLSAAIETLEKLGPESLKPLIVPLLVSPIHGIRSRAVRLLHRWDPAESLKHFESMLFSQDSTERQAALFHAFFFPFPDIQPLMLRFLSVEGDSTILQKAGYLFRANPDAEILLSLTDIMEASRPDKRKIVGELISGVIKSLSQAGLIEKAPEAIMTDLKALYRQKKAGQLLERCRLALAGSVENRQAAVAKLQELYRAGFSQARELLSAHLKTEADANVKISIETFLGSAPGAEKVKGRSFFSMEKTERMTLLSTLNEATMSPVKLEILGNFGGLTQEEKLLFVQTFAWMGEKSDIPFLVQCLDDGDPMLVSSAIESLHRLQPEALFGSLPKLLLHPSESVRAASVRASFLFNKEEALGLLNEMLLSVQPQNRSHAIFSIGQLDFPSTRQLLLKTLERETDQANLQQIRTILKANIDKDLLVEVLRIRHTHIGDPEKLGFLEAIAVEMAKFLVKEGKTTYKDSADLLRFAEEKIKEETRKNTEAKPSYAFDNVKKLRVSPVKAAKPVDPILILEGDLKSSDLSMRFSLLNRIESIEWTAERVSAFKILSEKEADSGTRFHMRKILVRVTQAKEARDGSRNYPEELETLLKKSPRDELNIALLLESIPRKDASAVAGILRKAEWASFSAELLPFVLPFFRKYGAPEDAPTIEALCRHSDPRVLSGAVETLEKLNPESLKGQIVPLLVSPHHGVRSRAVRLLHRWDPKEAMRHFEAMLFSDDPNDRMAALFHAYFFSFEEIEPHLLRFLGVEDDPLVLEKAGFLFRINPLPEEPFRLIDVMEAGGPNKRQIIGGILKGLVNSLSQAGIIQASPEQILSDLQEEYKNKKVTGLMERYKLELQSENLENRQNAVSQLFELNRRGFSEGLKILTGHLNLEKDLALKTLIEAQLGISRSAAAPLVENLEKSTPEQRIRLFSNLEIEGLARIRGQLGAFFRKARREEKVLLIQALGRVGEKTDLPLLQEALGDQEPQVLSAAIEALSTLDPDLLSPFLPKLIQHSADEVRIIAVRVFALFDKKQALALVEKMLFSPIPRQRHMAIFCAGQFDFPSVREVLIKALTRELDLENFRQIGLVLKSNADEQLLVGIMAGSASVQGSREELFEGLVNEIGTILVQNKKTHHSDLAELKSSISRQLEEEEKRRQAAQPSYALSNIQKMRREQAPAMGIDASLVRFTIVAFVVGAVLTALIWFLILKPGHKARGKKGAHKVISNPEKPRNK